MTTNQKQSIYEAVEAACAKGTKNSELARMASVNDSFITHVRNPSKWEDYSNGTPIPDRIWNKIKLALGVGESIVETSQYTAIFQALQKAKLYSNPSIIDGSTGVGKTNTINEFIRKYSNATYKITSARDFTSKSFIRELAHEIQAESDCTAWDIRHSIQIRLSSDTKPIVIVDEAENLCDGNYAAIKAIYDNLIGRVGLVLVGANEYWGDLEKKGRRKGSNAKCFPQVVSRFRSHVTKVPPISIQDVELVCASFGIVDKAEIKRLYNSTHDYRDLFGTLNAMKIEEEINSQVL